MALHYQLLQRSAKQQQNRRRCITYGGRGPSAGLHSARKCSTQQEQYVAVVAQQFERSRITDSSHLCSLCLWKSRWDLTVKTRVESFHAFPSDPRHGMFAELERQADSREHDQNLKHQHNLLIVHLTVNVLLDSGFFETKCVTAKCDGPLPSDLHQEPR